MVYTKNMAKQKKKRNKPYTGADAAMAKPNIIRIEAANRNKLAQWWFDHKRIAKPVLITAGVVLVIVVCILELIRLSTG